jgi:hypothetical protein
LMLGIGGSKGDVVMALSPSASRQLAKLAKPD